MTGDVIQHTHARSIDWLLVVPVVLLSFLGVITMNSFTGSSVFFERQMVWIGIGLVVLASVSLLDMRMLRRRALIVALYIFSATTLVLVLFFGTTVLGATNRFDFGFFSFQPGDLARIVLILVLAKYFTRRHVEIAHIRHIFVSGVYTGLFCFLLFLEPDFGSAVILAVIWFGMLFVAGISRKHIMLVCGVAVIGIGLLWVFAFQDYQKERIMTFLRPLADIQGAGYNAYQSTIAVGSGGVLGKGIGYGSQSKLEFLPEYETDFIFAAFAEEWGFVGVVLLCILFGTLFWRLLVHARFGSTTFETLVILGIFFWLFAQFALHVGMNMGMLPVTGTTMPFLSYGGSHLLTEYLAIGIVLSMSRYQRVITREKADGEIEGAPTILQ
jgi:rod shape determining protein RodA